VPATGAGNWKTGNAPARPARSGRRFAPAGSGAGLPGDARFPGIRKTPANPWPAPAIRLCKADPGQTQWTKRHSNTAWLLLPAPVIMSFVAIVPLGACAVSRRLRHRQVAALPEEDLFCPQPLCPGHHAAHMTAAGNGAGTKGVACCPVDTKSRERRIKSCSGCRFPLETRQGGSLGRRGFAAATLLGLSCKETGRE
jgi:hypothetical protein